MGKRAKDKAKSAREEKRAQAGDDTQRGDPIERIAERRRVALEQHHGVLRARTPLDLGPAPVSRLTFDIYLTPRERARQLRHLADLFAFAAATAEREIDAELVVENRFGPLGGA